MRISDWNSDVCSSDLPSRKLPKFFFWAWHRGAGAASKLDDQHFAGICRELDSVAAADIDFSSRLDVQHRLKLRVPHPVGWRILYDGVAGGLATAGGPGAAFDHADDNAAMIVVRRGGG